MPSPFGLPAVVKNRSRRFFRTKGIVKYLIFRNLLTNGLMPICKNMAESEGFEPSIRFPVYTLSRGAPSATRPALLNSNCYPVTSFIPASTWRTCALLRASCPAPFGPSAKNADVQNRSRRFCQPLGQLSGKTVARY